MDSVIALQTVHICFTLIFFGIFYLTFKMGLAKRLTWFNVISKQAVCIPEMPICVVAAETPGGGIVVAAVTPAASVVGAPEL